jgi:hypothetical protein
VLRTPMTPIGAPRVDGLRLGHAMSSGAPGCPFAYRGVLAAALSVSQAHYVMDKLLCVCCRIGVVLLISAQCMVFREYLLSPIQKFLAPLRHMGNEHL